MTTTIGGSYPAVNSDSDATINGLTVGKGGSAVDSNTAVGINTNLANTSGTDNTAIGNAALKTNSTSSYNTAIGSNALNLATGARNTAVGAYTQNNQTTGASNSSLGVGALNINSTGSYNVAIGDAALLLNTTASNNTAVGYQALYSNTTNADSTAIGQGALYYANAIENTAIGKNAGNSTTSGTSNVYVGMQAGNWNVNHTTGSNCVFIGERTSPAVGSDSYEIVIGAGCIGKGGSTGFIYAGGGGVYQGNNSATWSITSDARLKKNIVDNATGLSAINAIQIRNFEYRTKDEVTDLPSQNAINISGVQLGAIAQELQSILPDCVKTESTGVMSVDTTNLTWYLINAVKELNAKVTALTPATPTEAQAAVKASALAKLTALGLTENEIKALVG